MLFIVPVVQYYLQALQHFSTLALEKNVRTLGINRNFTFVNCVMYKTNQPTLSTYTSLKRKWQDTDAEDISDAESEVDADESDLEDSDEDSDVCSLDTLLAVLNASSSTPTLTQQAFCKQLQASLLLSLQESLKELTTIKELAEKLCSLTSSTSRS